MKRILHNQSGAVLVIFALLLIVLVGFMALGMEVGRWYLVRSELSKGVDAAAMAGAKNISNPYIQMDTFVQEMGKENFPPGYLDTPGLQKSQIDEVKKRLENYETLLDRVSRILNSNFVKMTFPVFSALYDASDSIFWRR